MGNLYYSIGCPRSGKSTIGRKWVKREVFIDNNGGVLDSTGLNIWSDNPRIVVNSDAIRLAMHGQVYAREAEGYVAVTAEMMLRMFLVEGYDVYYDETNTSIESLRRVYRASKDAIPVIVPTLPSECKRRAVVTNQEYLFPVIDRCAEQMTELLAHFDYHISEVKKYLEYHV